jgi:hypothetical protein
MAFAVFWHMEIFLMDAIGPFFRGLRKKKVNWSKIPFTHLDGLTEEEWEGVGGELRRFAGEVRAQGYTAVSLDDVAHLAHHAWHEAAVRERIAGFRRRFEPFIRMLREEFGLDVYLTSDVLPLTPGLEEVLDGDHAAMEAYFRGLVTRLLDEVPGLSGVILRIGESDGTDVRDELRTRLHVRCPDELNEMLKDLLPEFEKRGKTLILRTWTVGAHAVGDLMWNAETLRRALEGVDSERLIVSMKHGESDFFRYLPLNPLFREGGCRMMIEVQARREYEGAGEYPSFLGTECEEWSRDLADCPHVVGVSVWCQTGGWHRFHRRAFLEEDGSDVWIRINTSVVTAVFRDGMTAREGVRRVVGDEAVDAAMRLLGNAERVVRELLYVGAYARKALFFRRVRIPPLFHVYWDTVFVNPGVRSLLRWLVDDEDGELRAGEEVFGLFPAMINDAREAGLRGEDIEHMRDFMEILLLVRRYGLGLGGTELEGRIAEAKRAYKERWPKTRRYRIRISWGGMNYPPGVVGVVARVFFRRGRAYRMWDRWFVLPMPGVLYRSVHRCSPDSLPKFLRKSAMGVDVVLR